MLQVLVAGILIFMRRKLRSEGPCSLNVYIITLAMTTHSQNRGEQITDVCFASKACAQTNKKTTN